MTTLLFDTNNDRVQGGHASYRSIHKENYSNQKSTPNTAKLMYWPQPRWTGTDSPSWSVLLCFTINFCKYGFDCRKVEFLVAALVHFKENACWKLILFPKWSQKIWSRYGVSLSLYQNRSFTVQLLGIDKMVEAMPPVQLCDLFKVHLKNSNRAVTLIQQSCMSRAICYNKKTKQTSVLKITNFEKE